jgi:hypothetical protein
MRSKPPTAMAHPCHKREENHACALLIHHAAVIGVGKGSRPCHSRKLELIKILDFFFCSPHSGRAAAAPDDALQEVSDATPLSSLSCSPSWPPCAGQVPHCAWKTSPYGTNWPSTNSVCHARGCAYPTACSGPGCHACGPVGKPPWCLSSRAPSSPGSGSDAATLGGVSASRAHLVDPPLPRRCESG